MRILAIDHGDRFMGLALSDPLQITSQPFGRYEVKGKKTDKTYFRTLAETQEVGEVVVGLPLQMDGSRGERAHKVEAFAEWLRGVLGIPVVLWDERLTTREAVDRLRERNIFSQEAKRFKDQLAAGIILEEYLEHKRRNKESASS